MEVAGEWETVVTAAQEDKGHHDGYRGDQECEGKEVCECVGENGRLQPTSEGRGEREREILR